MAQSRQSSAVATVMVVIVAAYAATAVSAGRINATPQRLIVDTDMGFDVDDVMAVCLANTLHWLGEVELLAVVHDTGCHLGIGGPSAINHFYGHDNITLGAWKGQYGSNCYEKFDGAGGQDQYLSNIINNPRMAGPVRNYSQVPLGTVAYRKTLATVPDHSVNIASIGMPTNLRDLLQTKPDEYSPLNGYDLIAAKVNKIVFMDGMYNFGCADGLIGPALDCEGSAQAALKMPPNVSMVFSRAGQNPNIYTGQDLQQAHPANSPCRQAIKLWCCDPNGKSGAVQGRLSWDPITVMIASLGVDAVFEKEVNVGTHVRADEAGHEFFWQAPPPTLNAQTDFNETNSPNLIPGAINHYLNMVPPPLPPPTDYDGYVLGSGLNCWPGHGANDLPTTSDPMSLAQCRALCDGTSGCTGVVTTPNGITQQYHCYMKSDINWAQCQTGTTFDTWAKGTYVEAGGFNCYGPRNGQPGHGAVDLEHPPSSSCGVMTVQACQQKCNGTPGCDGITTSDAGNGLINCYRKGDIVLSACDHDTSFNTYKA